jgi:hypothetical protein
VALALGVIARVVTPLVNEYRGLEYAISGATSFTTIEMFVVVLPPALLAVTV